MSAAGRLGDKAQVQGAGDAHGCPACPHPGVGPAIIGSPTVNINSRPALRINDIGIHAACCGANMWVARVGAPTVNINGKQAFRMNDMGQSCGGVIKLIEGSNNVNIGESTSGGGGAGGAGSASGGGGGGGGASGGSASASSSHQAGTPAGTYSSQSRSGGGTRADRAAFAAGSTPPASTPSEEDERKSWIEVVLTDEEGNPLANQDYKIELPDMTIIEGKSGPDGTIKRVDIPDGAARLWIPDDDPPTSIPPLPQKRFAPEDEEAFIEIELKDEDGRPMANLPIKLELPDGTILEEKLDADGRLRKEGIKPGSARLHIPDVEAANDAKKRLARAEEKKKEPEKGVIDVQLVDDAGRPMANATVKVELPDGSVVEKKLDAEGRLYMPDVKAGDFKVHVPEEPEEKNE